MVDGLTAPGADGKDTWSPRPPEEMETLRQLVQSAIGFDETRGDTVTIELLQFTLPTEQGSLAEAGGPGFLDTHGARLAQLGVLGAIVLALIFFVLRPMTSRAPMLQLARADRPARAGAGAAAAGAARGGDILDLPAQTVNKIERLRDVITSRGEDSAAVLRSWIEVPRDPQGARRIMSAYRLETFAPAAGGAPHRLSPAERRLEAARQEAFQEGFLAGQSMATEAFLEEEGRLTSDLVEAIADARMTNEAARRHVAASLAPMVEALAEAVAPALADAGLGAEIARLVERALAQSAAPRPRLRCAPEVAGRIAALLSARGLEATIEPSPELLPREAQVFWDQGYDHLDLEACIAQIRACIASHLEPGSKGEQDDPRQYG